MMKNIELFKNNATKILDRLYSDFPSPLDIHIETASDDRDFFINTFEFLERSGFVTCSKIDASFIRKAGLCMKGLTALNKVPDSLRSQPSPFIEALLKL